jgi:1,4-alpha-glucan branching enzyme
MKEFDMLKKSYTKTKNACRVTFKLPADVDAKTAVLCGDFNNWDESADPMKQLKDGSFSATVSVPAPQTYRFRYLLDGERWENDWEADGYAPNEFGTNDSILEV